MPPQMLAPGEYCWHVEGWVARTPDGALCYLRDVFEHDDLRVSAVTPKWLLIEGKWHA